MYVSHLECPKCTKNYESEQIRQLCDCGVPLLVRYDLEKIKAAFRKDDLKERKPDLWRYRELLPVKNAENIICLGEGMTPLLSLNNLGRKT
jgi:threonine synthase